jgi:SAM-dependent methyltransferase
MRKKLLEFLVCPECKGELSLDAPVPPSGEILEGSLKCAGCSRSYRIEEGVPNMLSAALPEDKKKTSAFFALGWDFFDNKTVPGYEELLCTYVSPLPMESFKGRAVLEAGCGSGRNLVASAKAGAAEVIGLDFSDSVKLAYAKTKGYENIHVVRGDILKPPFKTAFDLIFSVGVLHHLPSPQDGFLSLSGLLKKDGIMAISVYAKENNEWIIKYFNPVRKNLLAPLPAAVPVIVAFFTAAVFYPFIKLLYGPLNRSESTRGWARKHLFYNDFMYLMSQWSFNLIWGQFWDQMSAPTAFYISREEIEGWYSRAGLSETAFEWRNRNAWNGVGVRRAA